MAAEHVGQRDAPRRLQQRGVVEHALELDDAAADAIALLAHHVVERLDVGLQGVAGLEQLLDLGLGRQAGALGAQAGLRLDLGPDLRRLLAGLAQQAGRLVLRLLDGGVGRALGQHERAAQRVVGLGDVVGRRPTLGLVELPMGVGRPALGALGPHHRIAHAVMQGLHAAGDPLQEVVDVSRVVPAAPRLTELDSVKRLRSQVHDQRE